MSNKLLIQAAKHGIPFGRDSPSVPSRMADFSKAVNKILAERF